MLCRSGERMPQGRFATTNFDFRNNIVFDWAANGSGGYGMRIPNDDGQSGSRKVDANIVGNVFVPGGGNPRAVLYYATAPGSQASTSDGDGGPAACTTSDGCAGCPNQGDVVSTSFMGELWVSGNTFPAQICDQWSTVGQERTVPAEAAVTTEDAASLPSTLLPAVGTHFRQADEQALLDEIDQAG